MEWTSSALALGLASAGVPPAHISSPSNLQQRGEPGSHGAPSWNTDFPGKPVTPARSLSLIPWWSGDKGGPQQEHAKWGQSILRGRKTCAILAKPKDHPTIRADQQGSQLARPQAKWACLTPGDTLEEIPVSAGELRSFRGLHMFVVVIINR